ncbi:hypothetical protein SprV_0301059900 [Sparganum proliferum]
MGSRRQGSQIRRYKDTLKISLKRLQISPANWEDLTRDRPTLKKTLKSGAAIYEANRIAVVKARREARKYQLRPPHYTNVQPPPTSSRCQQTFRAPIGLEDIYVPTASPELHQSLSARRTLSRPPR